MEMPVVFMIFLAVGIIFLGMITVFMKDFDMEGDVETLIEIQNGTAADLYKVDLNKFLSNAREFYSGCDEDNDNQTVSYYVYYKESNVEGNLTKEGMFDFYKKVNWCGSVQSKTYGCGTREDVNFTEDIILPKVVRLRCENYTLFVS